MINDYCLVNVVNGGKNNNRQKQSADPIARDFRTVVCPFIDVIDMNNFEYRAQDEGKRGAFDWELYYKRLDLLPEDLQRPTEPFKSPVMAGGLFAISAKWFWELGGYDEGLMIWGGEQYELSFKVSWALSELDTKVRLLWNSQTHMLSFYRRLIRTVNM